ncbi:efflux RND transporter periplasmic adaptor subunit [Muriicola sp. SD30]|uniref:efflux RND transporter periplasmic adaptor subunit n=1 Tax=Muriicola sp. SD30 TaxID=3240936 RepID=UPI0035107332
MKHRNYIIGLFALTFLAFGCGTEDKKTIANNDQVVTVRVSSVYQDNSNSFVTASGKVEAAKSTNLSTRMMGYVDNIYVKVGDKVRSGQLLMSVNNADISAKLAQVNAGITEAQAAFNNAEKDYTRYTALFKENSASQKEFDDISARFEMARARLEAARQIKNEVNAQLSYANIRAPFNGVVTNKFINTGDMANPGMPLLEVEAPGTYQVLAMVPESEILDIQKDTKVDVQLKTLDKIVSGKITEVSTSARNTGGQYMVKVLLDTSDANILSGMYATVQFPVAQESSQTIMVPNDALVHNGQLTGIYTVSQNNTALLRWLRLGRTFGEKVEVLAGLSADEEYIVSADGKLFNGVKISVQ